MKFLKKMTTKTSPVSIFGHLHNALLITFLILVFAELIRPGFVSTYFLLIIPLLFSVLFGLLESNTGRFQLLGKVVYILFALLCSYGIYISLASAGVWAELMACFGFITMLIMPQYFLEID